MKSVIWALHTGALANPSVGKPPHNTSTDAVAGPSHNIAIDSVTGAAYEYIDSRVVEMLYRDDDKGWFLTSLAGCIYHMTRSASSRSAMRAWCPGLTFTLDCPDAEKQATYTRLYTRWLATGAFTPDIRAAMTTPSEDGSLVLKPLLRSAIAHARTALSSGASKYEACVVLAEAVRYPTVKAPILQGIQAQIASDPAENLQHVWQLAWPLPAPPPAPPTPTTTVSASPLSASMPSPPVPSALDVFVANVRLVTAAQRVETVALRIGNSRIHRAHACHFATHEGRLVAFKQLQQKPQPVQRHGSRSQTVRGTNGKEGGATGVAGEHDHISQADPEPDLDPLATTFDYRAMMLHNQREAAEGLAFEMASTRPGFGSGIAWLARERALYLGPG